jgi:hypothetical protein
MPHTAKITKNKGKKGPNSNQKMGGIIITS